MVRFWGRLLTQEVKTLNLLRNPRINTRFLVEAQVNEQFNYEATPMAPPGTKLIVHENSQQRGSWYPHGTNG